MLEQSHKSGVDPAVAVEQAQAILASTPLSEDEAKYQLSRTKRLGIGGILAIAWLVFLVLFAILVPIFAKASRNAELANQGFLSSLSHPFGGDRNGNNLTVLLAEGARNSLAVGIGAIAFGLLIGGSLGLVAGYVRGRLDSILTGIFNVLLAIPQLILALSLVAVLSSRKDDNGADIPVTFGQRLGVLILALGLVSVPVLARITRANALQWSQREFVLAARAQGSGKFRTMVREVLPNVLPAMFSIALLGIAVVIVAEGGLSFLGAGVKGGVSLGSILAGGRNQMVQSPHIVFEPIAFIFFTVLSLNYLGDVVRARFDVREAVL